MRLFAHPEPPPPPHVHRPMPRWTGKARNTCYDCGKQVPWRSCCYTIEPAEHDPGCAVFRQTHPIASRLR